MSLVAWYGIPGREEGFVKITFDNLAAKRRFERVTNLVCMKCFKR